jgi:predicted nucleic acid-binding Zn ribbon protein
MTQCMVEGCNEPARRKFCSERHQKLWHNSRRPKRQKHAHKCVSCGAEFKGRLNAKVCSNRCAVRLHRARKAS